jgi:insulysin
VYYFDVQNNAFEEALDMFASFFTCPLFNADSTDREITAVDNENTKNLQSDSWRGYQLLKSLAVEGHPFHYFSTGNAATLRSAPAEQGIDVRALLLDWYARHYSANIMKLCVYSSDSLDAMQAAVEARFSDVANRDLPAPTFPGAAYTPERMGRYLEVVPVCDVKHLEIYFVLPPTDEHYRSKPTRYLTHLIGHESGGSILSALKARGWANSLSAGDYQSITDFSLLCVTLELTQEGFGHIDEVLACVMAYIDMLKREGARVQWIQDEVKNIADMEFRYNKKGEPSMYVTRVANSMQVYPPEHIVSGSKLVFDADTALIPVFLDAMTLENSIIMVSHKDFAGKTSEEERWYGTQYNCRQYSEQQRAAWTDGQAAWRTELHLPKQNPFIPTDFRLRHEGKADAESRVGAPVLIHEVVRSSGDEDELYYTGDEPAADADPAPDAAAAEEEEEEEENGEAVTAGPSELRVLDGNALRVWHKLDRHWLVPQTNMMIKLECMMATCTAANVALTDLFTQMLKDAMNEYAYYADCAGLCYDVRLAKSGIQLTFFGYSHKLAVLVTKTAECMGRLSEGHAELFARLKEKTVQQYANYLFWQPYMHCLMGATVCLEDPRFTNAEKHAALLPLTLDDFHCFARAFTSALKAEVLVHGNAAPEEARELAEGFCAALGAQPLPLSQEPIRRVVALEPGRSYLFRQHCAQCNPEEKNSAIMNLYAVGAESAGGDETRVSQEALLSLMGHLVSLCCPV